MVKTEVAGAESTVPKSTNQPEGAQNTDTKSAFIEKAKELPVVHAVTEYTTSTYNQVKHMNSLTNYALSTAESTILACALAATPFFQKIQPQAKIVDEMACRGLEVLEANCSPLLHMRPEEVVEVARKLCAETLQTGYQKVEEVKNLGTETVSSVTNYGLQKANDCITGTEKLLDRYLPSLQQEEIAANEDLSVAERAAELPVKIGYRVRDYTLQQVVRTLNLTREHCTKLDQLMQVMENTHKRVEGKTPEERKQVVLQMSKWLVDELLKEEPANVDDAAKSLEQRMLSVARRIASGLVYTMSVTVVPLTELQQSCAANVRAARNYAVDLFTQFDQAVRSGEAASVVLERARSTISAFQGAIANLVDNLRPKEETIEMQDLSLKESTTESTVQESAGDEGPSES